MIVADTGAIIALIDRMDPSHRQLRAAFESVTGEWVLPWAILPEVDYLLGAHVSARAQDAFFADVADGAFTVAWGTDEDLAAAERLTRQHRALRIGLVDAIVMVTAVRLRANAIATLDLKHFGAVTLPRPMKLLPRDLA
jgi:uncharacterized protein